MYGLFRQSLQIPTSVKESRVLTRILVALGLPQGSPWPCSTVTQVHLWFSIKRNSLAIRSIAQGQIQPLPAGRKFRYTEWWSRSVRQLLPPACDGVGKTASRAETRRVFPKLTFLILHHPRLPQTTQNRADEQS